MCVSSGAVDLASAGPRLKLLVPGHQQGWCTNRTGAAGVGAWAHRSLSGKPPLTATHWGKTATPIPAPVLPAAAEKAARPKPTIAPVFQKSGPPPAFPPRILVRPAPPVIRTAMSDMEMERIMLGGAEP